MRKPKTTPAFGTEVDLCRAFIAQIPETWTSYAETAGWDILLVRNADGFQIGIQAKLRLNTDVLNQALESRYSWNMTGPDCRAVLVPDGGSGGLALLAEHVGITVIALRQPPSNGVYYNRFSPPLPDEQRPGWNESDWHEQCPTRRCKLPEYVPDVAAGSSAPIQLTDWKIRAIKVAVLAEIRGGVTRADFKALGIDARRWLTPGAEWMVPGPEGKLVPGAGMPNLKKQHPKVWKQIKADADKWLPPLDASLKLI